MSNLLSVVIIAKNEEKFIGDAIKSAEFADEVLLLDSGSTDGTCKIAKKLGADFIIRTNKRNLKNKLRSLENLFFNVVECTGNLNILNSSIKCAKVFGGRYIVIGNYPNTSKINIYKNLIIIFICIPLNYN